MFEEQVLDDKINKLNDEIMLLNRKKKEIELKRKNEAIKMGRYEMSKFLINDEHSEYNQSLLNNSIISLKTHTILTIKMDNAQYDIDHVNKKITGKDARIQGYFMFQKNATKHTFKFTKVPISSYNVSISNIDSLEFKSRMGKIRTLKNHRSKLLSFINWIDIECYITKVNEYISLFAKFPIMEHRHNLLLVLAKYKDSLLSEFPKDIILYICKIVWKDLWTNIDLKLYEVGEAGEIGEVGEEGSEDESREPTSESDSDE